MCALSIHARMVPASLSQTLHSKVVKGREVTSWFGLAWLGLALYKY